MRFFITGLMLLFINSICLSQIKLSGRILNTQKEPIPFAHIGIPGKSVGTASFEDGSFSLSIPQKFKNEELKLSAIGYEERSLKISELKSGKEINLVLQEKVIALNEVEVSTRKSKPSSLFKTEKRSGGGQTWFGDSGGGTEMFTKVRMEEGLYQVKEVHLKIGKNTVDTFRIRFSFYEVNDRDEPGSRIVEESFIVESSVKKGLVKFKFDSTSVWIENDFYLGFEWIISSAQRANQLATKVNWADYGAPEDLGENTLSVESWKKIVIRDPNNTLIQEIPLSKSQRKEIQAKQNARQVTYLDMTGNHGSLYRVRSFADLRKLVSSPFIEIIGHKID